MPRERSLFERLRNPDPEGSRRIHVNTQRMIDSVLDNLDQLLNERHGNTPIQEDYGIPSISDLIHNFPDATQLMRTSLKTTIEKYEPRLRRVSVKAVKNEDDPLALDFEITAELVTEDDRQSVWFETHIDSQGKVKLSS